MRADYVWIEVMGVLPEGAPYYIAGAGLIDGQAGGQNVFLLTANVPEPTTLGFLAAIALLVIHRHSR